MSYPSESEEAYSKALSIDRVKQRVATQGVGKRNLTGVEVLEPERLGEERESLGKGEERAEDAVECLAF